MIIRSGKLIPEFVTASISPPFLSTGVVYAVHWRYASRPCEHTDKTIFSARLPAREGDRLHRVDAAISQLWFDVEMMRVAMELAEQRAWARS